MTLLSASSATTSAMRCVRLSFTQVKAGSFNQLGPTWGSMAVFHRCKCYLTNNIFLKQFSLHVNYFSDEQFSKDYKSVLSLLGCSSKEFEIIINQVKTEIESRRNSHSLKEERLREIQANYKPLHPTLYSKIQPETSIFESTFLELVHAANTSNSWEGIRKHLTVISNEQRLYSFPVFNRGFCQMLYEELNHFEKSPFEKGRPNSMNRYGILMEEIGLNNCLIDLLRSQYFSKIAKILFPECVNEGLDSHKAFTVKYKTGDDVDLSYHFDNAEVTVNICLGLDFSGGELYFGPMKDKERGVVGETSYVEAPHSLGIGIIHRGQHLHGAMPIEDGERQNLIIWMRSSSVRNAKCPMCNQKPVLEKCNDYGDGFTS